MTNCYTTHTYRYTVSTIPTEDYSWYICIEVPSIVLIDTIMMIYQNLQTATSQEKIRTVRNMRKVIQQFSLQRRYE